MLGFNRNRFNNIRKNLFGYRIPEVEKKEKKLDKEIVDLKIIQPDMETGSVITDETEFTSTSVDVDSVIRRNKMYIEIYRMMEKDPTIDFAVNEIVNDVINVDSEEDVIEVDLSSVKDITDNIKEKIIDEWEILHDIFKLNEFGHERIRRYYVDGSVYYHMVVNTKKPKEGIKNIIPLDPRYTKKVHEIRRKTDEETVEILKSKKEYYIYSTEPEGISHGGFLQTYGRQLKLSPDTIVHANSGLFGSGVDLGIIYSHLEVCKKPLNVLNQIEAALLIFRITRAPNRRLFSIDVGNLPAKAANAEVAKYAKQYRTVVEYNETTGETSTNGKKLAITDDFFLPQRDGKGTNIDNIEGSTDFLRDIEDLGYFDKKLRRATHVPYSRFESEPSMLGSRLAEITRDEWRFAKFIKRIRKGYMVVFKDIIKTQLILKKIITLQDWETKFEPYISFVFKSDSIIVEMQEMEALSEKLNLITSTDGLIGKYFSNEWVRRNILKQTDQEMEIEDGIIEKEKTDPRYAAAEVEDEEF